jgi:hypothetical protein
MPTERANDLVAFRMFIDEQLSRSGFGLTLDEALARWESENQTPEERRGTIRAVREGLDDLDAGKTKAIHDFPAELRKTHGLTSSTLALQCNPEEWVKLVRTWVQSQPIRPNKMDDSRESIYAGRGE